MSCSKAPRQKPANRLASFQQPFAILFIYLFMYAFYFFVRSEPRTNDLYCHTVLTGISRDVLNKNNFWTHDFGLQWLRIATHPTQRKLIVHQ